jgi:hypothetical protein
VCFSLEYVETQQTGQALPEIWDGLTFTRFCGVNERGNSIQLLLVRDRTDVSQ